MNCKKCGNILKPTDIFCENCGEPVITTSEIQTEASNTQTQNLAGGMNFTTPTTPTQNSQEQQQPIMQNSESSIATVQETVQPTIPEQNNNVMEQPTAVPQMTLNQAINNQTETMPTNEKPTITEQNNNVTEQPAAVPQMTLSQTINSQMGVMAPEGQSPVTPNQPTMQQMTSSLQPNNLTQTQTTGVTIQTEPTEPTKKKNPPILIAILIIALIGIVAFEVIYFVKPFDKKENNNTINNNNQEIVTSDNEYANWMNYILEQNITNILLERIPTDDSENQEAPLIVDNLKTIFEELKEYPLVKKYLEGTGFTGGDKLTISYTKEDNNYEVIIANGMIYADNVMLKDDDLRNALEESEYTTENEDLKDKDGVFYNYIFDNYDSTIFDEYFIAEKIDEEQ